VKRACSWIILLAIVVFGITSCNPSADELKNSDQGNGAPIKFNTDDVMDSGPVKGGTLKLFSTTPDTLNPLMTDNLYVQDFSRLIFESLVKLDRNQKPTPELADSWEVSDDGLTWNFHIRENVFWHDNMPFTAEDVEFTFETILNGNVNSVYKTNLKNVATYAAVDRNNFKIILVRPDSFTAELLTFPIIPKHYFVGEDILKSQRNMAPIGTGPYKFMSFQNKDILLRSSENWWKSKSTNSTELESPYIYEIDIKIFDGGLDTISAFQTRDVDVAFLDAGECSKYSGRTDLILKKFPGRNFEFMSINTTKPGLNEIPVRQAISYAIDKSKIINDTIPGEAVLADIPLIPDTWLNSANPTTDSYNPQKARELLLKNGWKEDREVMYKYINGVYTQLNLEILVNDDNDKRYKIADKISEQLKKIGIASNIKKVSWDEEMNLLNTKRYDMALLGCRITSTPDVSFMYSSAEIVSGRNTAGYSNPDVDKYLEQLRNETDSDKRKAYFTDMNNIISSEVPYIGLYFYNDAVVYNKRIRGNMNPYIWDKYFDISKWYIPVG